MSTVYVVKNQHGFFASKQKDWIDGREPKLLFRSPHKDEAINMVFEVSSKDIEVRAEAMTVELAANKHPIVEVTAPAPVEVDANTVNIETDESITAEVSSSEAETSNVPLQNC